MLGTLNLNATFLFILYSQKHVDGVQDWLHQRGMQKGIDKTPTKPALEKAFDDIYEALDYSREGSISLQRLLGAFTDIGTTALMLIAGAEEARDGVVTHEGLRQVLRRLVTEPSLQPELTLTRLQLLRRRIVLDRLLDADDTTRRSIISSKSLLEGPGTRVAFDDEDDEDEETSAALDLIEERKARFRTSSRVYSREGLSRTQSRVSFVDRAQPLDCDLELSEAQVRRVMEAGHGHHRTTSARLKARSSAPISNHLAPATLLIDPPPPAPPLHEKKDIDDSPQKGVTFNFLDSVKLPSGAAATLVRHPPAPQRPRHPKDEGPRAAPERSPSGPRGRRSSPLSSAFPAITAPRPAPALAAAPAHRHVHGPATTPLHPQGVSRSIWRPITQMAQPVLAKLATAKKNVFPPGAQPQSATPRLAISPPPPRAAGPPSAARAASHQTVRISVDRESQPPRLSQQGVGPGRKSGPTGTGVPESVGQQEIYRSRYSDAQQMKSFHNATEILRRLEASAGIMQKK